MTRRAAAAVAAGLLAASCSGDPPPGSCPDVFVLGDAAGLARFAGPGRGPGDVAWEARIRRPEVSCDRSGRGVDVDVALRFPVWRETAGERLPVAFAYFVAVPGLEGRNAGKRIFPVEGVFEKDERRLSYRDDVELFLPASLGDARIVVGFQLSPEDLARSRKRRAGR